MVKVIMENTVRPKGGDVLVISQGLFDEVLLKLC